LGEENGRRGEESEEKRDKRRESVYQYKAARGKNLPTTASLIAPLPIPIAITTTYRIAMCVPDQCQNSMRAVVNDF
jgi:hypothetical protein